MAVPKEACSIALSLESCRQVLSDGALLRLWPKDTANHSGRADLWTSSVEFPYVQLGHQGKQFGFPLGDGHYNLQL